MCLNANINDKTKQSGSALVLAIFVLVIMAVLGSALIRMQQSSSETVVYEVIGTRAYAAAQTGIQWQLSEIFPLSTAVATLCAATGNKPDISATPGLENCDFAVTCTDNITHDGVQYYTVESTGTCRVAGVNTSRTIQVEARSVN